MNIKSAASQKILWVLSVVFVAELSFLSIYAKYQLLAEASLLGQQTPQTVPPTDKIDLAHYFYKQRKYAQAADCMEQELSSLRKKHDINLSKQLLFTAACYRNANKYEKAEQLYAEIFQLNNPSTNVQVLARDLNNLGVINYLRAKSCSSEKIAREKFASSENYYMQAINKNQRSTVASNNDTILRNEVAAEKI